MALLAGLALMLLVRGGKAYSPGELSASSRPGSEISGYASHAEFEGECKLCHQPLNTTQGILCVECHQEVGEQIAVANGTHGHIKNVNQCGACHADHRGRDFDPMQAAYKHFDHANTHFSLVWHQVNYDTSPMDCSACHTDDGEFLLAASNCATCHATDNIEYIMQHVKDFGSNCIACHDGQDRMVTFDHQTTDFALVGKHNQAACADCHGLNMQPGGRGGGGQMTMDRLASTSTACVSCHEEPEAHKGMFETNCATCHDPEAWSPAALEGKPFEHKEHTGFSLRKHKTNFDGATLVCKDCHQSALTDIDLQSCVDCHAKDASNPEFMAKHQEEYSPACLECHDGMDRMQNFNHASFFPLGGKHEEINCEDCHIDKKFAGTPGECVQCHEEPKLHAGFFGVQCQSCHGDQAWAPAQLIIHAFPLNHGSEMDSECKLCHAERYVEYTCYGCHDHQPGPIFESHTKAGVSAEELPNCTECHSNGLVLETQP